MTAAKIMREFEALQPLRRASFHLPDDSEFMVAGGDGEGLFVDGGELDAFGAEGVAGAAGGAAEGSAEVVMEGFTFCDAVEGSCVRAMAGAESAVNEFCKY